MRNVRALCCIGVCLLAAGQSLTQPSGQYQTGPRMLDSLLLAGNAEGFMAAWQKTTSAPGDFNWSPNDSISFGLLFIRLSHLSSSTEEAAHEACMEFYSVHSRFPSAHVGGSAQSMYCRFSDAFGRNQWKDALHYYYIAVYFRSKHVRENILRLNQACKVAHELFEEGNYPQVIEAVRRFRSEDPLDPAVDIVKDSLAPLYDNLERISTYRFEDRREALNAEIVRKRMTISLTGGLASYPQQKEHQTVLHFEEVSFDLQPLDASIGHYFSLSFDYYFSPTLSISIQARLDPMYNEDVPTEPFGVPDRAYIHLEQNLLSFAVGPRVYFAEKTGLRPCAGIVAGILRVHRFGAEMQSAKWAAWGVHATMGDAKVTYPWISVESGCEYEPSVDSRFYFGLYLALANHFGDTALMHHCVCSTELCVGLNVP